jgi:hypothetical protein
MDERTRAATYQDVLRIAELLEEEHVEYALIGGYALALQGIVRLDTLHAEPYAIRINDEFTVDVMNSASGFTCPELLPYRRRVEGINVLSLEGLLKMKEHGRLKDPADAEAIRKVLGSKDDG